MNWLTSIFGNPEETPLATMLTTPPSDLSAAVAGSLVTGRVEPRHVASIFFDLAQRGYLTIAQEAADVIFYRVENEEGSPLFERLVLRDLFGDRQATAFGRLSPTLHALLGATTNFIEDERQATRRENRRAKPAWQQFARALRSDLSGGADLYGAYFAYAVSFGATQRWSAKFEQIAAQPHWYRTPYPIQHAAELVALAQNIEQRLAQQSLPFTQPAVPSAFTHMWDESASGM